MLLTQTRYSLTTTPINNDIIAIGIGIIKFKEPIGMILPFQLFQKTLCLLTQTVFLGLILHLPGKEEIRPVDIRRQD